MLYFYIDCEEKIKQGMEAGKGGSFIDGQKTSKMVTFEVKT